MAKIAISLPDFVLEEIEETRRRTGETRSEFVRRAAQEAINRQKVRQWDDEYERAYRTYPETDTEVAVSEAGVNEVFAENPWEEDDSAAQG